MIVPTRVATLSSEVGGDEDIAASAEASLLSMRSGMVVFVIALSVCGKVRAKVWGNVLCEQQVRIRGIPWFE